MKLRGGSTSDEGMSVIEVVIAAVIMFFVLTAVLGLVATTTRMGVSARQRAASVNAISSHIEWMRSLDYDQLDHSPDGIVPAESIVNIDGFTVTMDTVLSDGAGDTREIQITATATGDGFTPMTLTQYVVIRDTDGIIAMLDAGDGPDITYVSPTPEEDSVIYGRNVWPGDTPLYISVRAEGAEETDLITDVIMSCQSLLLRDGTSVYAAVAEWHPGTDVFETSFRWDTRYIAEDGEKVQEGLRFVRTVATDSNGAQGVAERRFYVDNLAPGEPEVPEAVVKNATEARVSWEKAMEVDCDPDNPVFAPAYLGRCWKVTESGSLLQLTVPTLETNAWLQTTDPFSRYDFAVASASFRFMTERPYVPVAEPYVSRPLLAGTSDTLYIDRDKDLGIKKRTAFTDVTLGVSLPTFPVSAIRYDLYRSDSLDLVTSTLYRSDVDPHSDFVESFTKVVGLFGVPDPYYYAYKVTFTPAVYKPGQAETEIWSNIVGPVPADAGLSTMVETW